MRALWELKRATVGEVLEHLEGTPTPAYNTVLTTLGILERKGYVAHEKSERAYTYLPLVEQREARRSALSQVLHRFFDDSPELLVLDLLGQQEAEIEELRRVRDLLDQGPREQAGITFRGTRPRQRRRS